MFSPCSQNIDLLFINKRSASVLFTCIVLCAECAWHARFGEVFSGSAHGITTISSYPLIGDEIGQRINPTSSSVNTGVTGVFVLKISQICIVVFLFGYGDGVIIRRIKVVNFGYKRDQIEAQSSSVDVAGV